MVERAEKFENGYIEVRGGDLTSSFCYSTAALCLKG